MVKSTAKKLLTAVGLFDLLRYSFLYELFLRVFRPAQIRGRLSEIAFYQRAIGPIPDAATIFDVGGNRGFKTEVFMRLAKQVICVEPDRSNVDILRKKFRGNAAVTIVDAAVGAEAGQLMFNVIDPGSAYNTLSTKWIESLEHADGGRPALKLTEQYPVKVVTLDALIAQHGTPHYIKIDVEGFELEVIRGLSKPVPFISFELNLPDFRTEGLEILQILAKVMPNVLFNYCSEPAPDAFSTEQELKSAKWMSPSDFAALLSSTTEPYLEVYARDASAL
jgi:FkbM family methyltransferase